MFNITQYNSHQDNLTLLTPSVLFPEKLNERRKNVLQTPKLLPKHLPHHLQAIAMEHRHSFAQKHMKQERKLHCFLPSLERSVYQVWHQVVGQKKNSKSMNDLAKEIKRHVNAELGLKEIIFS